MRTLSFVGFSESVASDNTSYFLWSTKKRLKLLISFIKGEKEYFDNVKKSLPLAFAKVKKFLSIYTLIYSALFTFLAINLKKRKISIPDFPHCS